MKIKTAFLKQIIEKEVQYQLKQAKSNKVDDLVNKLKTTDFLSISFNDIEVYAYQNGYTGVNDVKGKPIGFTKKVESKKDLFLQMVKEINKNSNSKVEGKTDGNWEFSLKIKK